MSFRITTNGLLRNYRNNLYDNTSKVNKRMEQVQSGRTFSSYAEDPAAASQAFQLRRNFWRTGNQIDNTDHVISKFQTGWDALDAIIEGDGDTNRGLNGINSALRASSGAIGSARVTLGTDLKTTADSISFLMNTRYGEEYVFAGADGLNVPFTDDENGNLLYRGVRVDAPQPMTAEQFSAAKTENADSVKDFADYTAYRENYVDTYVAAKVMKKDANGNDEVDYEKSLQKASLRFNEATYVDIGLGFRSDANEELITATAFNSALSGLDFLGYGVDEDGNPKNIVSLMRELGTLYNSADPSTGDYQSYTYNGKEYTAEEAQERAYTLTKKLYSAIERVSEKHVELDSKTKYLKDNKLQLETTQYTLNEQINDTESMPMAEAILQMSWAQYCYNAALQIGSRILSQSLIDYMR